MSEHNRTGISNREWSTEEAQEREDYPAAAIDSPPPEDALGRMDEPVDENRDWQSSNKSGSRSTAQKKAGSRYADRAMPASNKVSGAFGKEPSG